MLDQEKVVGAIVATVTLVGAYLWKGKQQKKEAAERGKKELDEYRQKRLRKSQAGYVQQNYDISNGLKGQLSSNAKVATVDECTSLPVHMHKKRFYTAKDVMEEDGTADASSSDYSIWIDKVWNKDMLAFPHIIARVATANDVAICLAFAQKYANLKISVVGGAHSSMAFVDGAVLTIDLTLMNAVSYDAVTHECHAGPGALIRDVDNTCVSNGRFVPLGTNGDTGIAGLTLSGGHGWFSRKNGATVDSLVAIDVMLPDGTIYENIRDDNDNNNCPSTTQQRDILWACRGSGGHFGIVTKFYFATHPTPNNNQYLTGSVVPLCPTAAMKKDVISNWWSKIDTASNDTYSFLVVPSGAPVVPMLWLHLGPDAVKGKAALDTVPDLRGVTNFGGLFNVENSWKIEGHIDVQNKIAENQKHGFLYQTLVLLNDVTDGVVNCIVDSIGKAPPETVIILSPLGGKSTENDTNNQKSSLSTRSCKLWCLVESRWDPLGPDGNQLGRTKCMKWCRQFVSNINTSCPGAVTKTTHALSDLEDENAGKGNNVLVDLTNAAVARKLRAIKDRVDPTNVLSHNRKISSAK